MCFEITEEGTKVEGTKVESTQTDSNLGGEDNMKMVNRAVTFKIKCSSS